MDDLISREALKNDFDCVGFNDYDDYNRALRIIDNAPPIELTYEEILGEWIIAEIRCPLCLEYFDPECYSKKELVHCPICGARLKTKEGDRE